MLRKPKREVGVEKVAVKITKAIREKFDGYG
jgi:hypothetical protein